MSNYKYYDQVSEAVTKSINKAAIFFIGFYTIRKIFKFPEG